MKNNEPKISDGVADLISSLEKLNQQKLEIMDEGSAKAKIWSKIEPHVRSTSRAELNSLAQEIKAVPSIHPSRVKKAKIKESVIEYIETAHVGFRFMFGRKFFAAATTLAVLFFAFYPSLRFFPSVSAEKITYIEVEQGDVQILRGDKVLPIDGDRVLMEGDTVVVADGSFAQIYFLDDSRAALGPGAEIYMQKLYVSEENGSETQVEVVLDQGEAWIQVVNLYGEEDYFSVLAGDGQYKVDTVGDFNVTVDGHVVEVEVANNLVAFDVPYDDSYKQGLLGEGTQLRVNGDLIIEEIEDKDDDVWWNYNLAQGENHLDEVRNYYITESAKKVKLMPGDPLHTLKQFKETATTAVTFDVNKVERSMEEADSRLAEAEQLFTEGESEAAKEKLDAYIEIVEGVVSDEKVSDQDRQTVEAQVDEATKALSVKVPENGDLAPIQEVLDEVDELVTDDQGATSLKKTNNASNRLNTALTQVNNGNYVVALESLQAYKAEVIEVALDVSDVDSENRAAVVSNILDRKITNLQLLKIIVDKLDKAGESSQIADEVRAQTFFEVNALVVSLKERAITKLTDFLADVESDDNIQFQVLGNLKKSVPMDFDLMQKINDIEEVYFDEGSVVFLLNE